MSDSATTKPAKKAAVPREYKQWAKAEPAACRVEDDTVIITNPEGGEYPAITEGDYTDEAFALRYIRRWIKVHKWGYELQADMTTVNVGGCTESIPASGIRTLATLRAYLERLKQGE